METTHDNKGQFPAGKNPYNRSGRILGGMVIIIAGSVLLARSAGALLPAWIFSWPVLLITIGTFFLAKNTFRKPGGLLLILIGSFFLIERLNPGLSIGAYFWPLLLIAGGLVYMFSRGRHHAHCNPEYQRANWRYRQHQKHGAFESSVTVGAGAEEKADPDAYLEVTTIFGGTKKKIISKNFKGGEVVTVFGGSEIDMTQAEITGPVVLEMTQIFGGTKLIIPAHWNLQSELVTILGGTEDKRNPSAFSNDPSKTLILHGTVAFGGIDIRSFH